MSEARALTNFVGNAVATIVVSRWENQLDLARASTVLGLASRPVPREPSFQALGVGAETESPAPNGRVKSMAP